MTYAQHAYNTYGAIIGLSELERKIDSIIAFFEPRDDSDRSAIAALISEHRANKEAFAARYGELAREYRATIKPDASISAETRIKNYDRQGMAAVIGGRENGDSDEMIIALFWECKTNAERAELTTLLEDHRLHQKSFEARCKELEDQEDAKKEELGKAREKKIKKVEAQYLKAVRRAFALPETPEDRAKATSRVLHDAPWMSSDTAHMPKCELDHLMNLAVYVTKREIASCTSVVQPAGDIIFCACVRPECQGRGEVSWAFIAEPRGVEAIRIMSGITVKALPVIEDHPGIFEAEQAMGFDQVVPGTPEYANYDLLTEATKRHHRYGLSKIGGFGSFAQNPPTCWECGHGTVDVLLTINPKRMGFAEKYCDAHMVLTACPECKVIRLTEEGS